MASKENQEALKHIKDINWFAPKINYKGEQYILYDFYKKDFDTLQQAIDELEEYKKYIPNLKEFYKWCKGEYLQKQGTELKSNALKESEKQ